MTTATQTVKERPILFSGGMVKAILDGRKTQTRRVMKPQPILDLNRSGQGNPFWLWLEGKKRAAFNYPNGDQSLIQFYCPYGKPGDRLWVRETWGASGYGCSLPINQEAMSYRLKYGDETYGQCRRSPIHMPRWASRINLEITNVRVERLNEISEEDADAEGISLTPSTFCYGDETPEMQSHRAAFQILWEKINGKKHPWSSNPWVWVVEFKKI